MTTTEASSPAHDDLPSAGRIAAPGQPLALASTPAVEPASTPAVGPASTPASRMDGLAGAGAGDIAAPQDAVERADLADLVGSVDSSGLAAHRALVERTRALKLINSGRATTATVDTVCDTGVRVNGRPVAEVHLLVERPGAEPYPVVRSAVAPDPDIDLATAATASSGRPHRIPVLVDPGRPDNVLLRWDLRPAS